MLNGGDHRFRDIVASALGWWADAGVDSLADDEPRDWLTTPYKPMPVFTPAAMPPAAYAPPPADDGFTAPPTQVAAPGNAATPAAAPATLPDTLEALHALLASGDYAPSPAPPGRRVAPSGDPASGLMIVADMPDQGDVEAGHLFAGETARLFDAMLAAMGRDRSSVYCAPLSPARAAGRIDDPQGEALTRLMRRHIALAKPRAMILFGDETARWLIGPDAHATRGGLRSIALDGTADAVPVIATFHPRHLRRMPSLKAATWADMRLLLGGLA